MPNPLAPVTLRGVHVVLEPLTPDHVDDLAAAAGTDRATFALAPIAGIGATFEGVLRHHRRRADDHRPRDTAVYSIIDRDWDAVAARLTGSITGSMAGS